MRKQVSDKTAAAISKLIELTQKSRIHWVSTDAPTPEVEFLSYHAGPAYEALHKGKRLRIYRRFPPSLRRNYGIGNNLGNKNPFLQEDESGAVQLEILDEEGSVIWRFFNEEMLEDLLSAVKYKASGAQDFIDDLLGEE